MTSRQSEPEVLVPDPQVTAVPDYKSTGLKRIVRAGGYSLAGLQHAFRLEAAFRQEVILATLLIPATLFLPVSATERLWLVVVTLIVLLVELLNSALETVVDRIGMEHHMLSGQAKDMGSAAVLIALLMWSFVWVSILWP